MSGIYDDKRRPLLEAIEVLAPPLRGVDSRGHSDRNRS